MKKVILYPTETIYALGVNAFDEEALKLLFSIKGREAGKSVSVIVRDLEDIKSWAKVGKKAEILAKKFLPGPLTLVLGARDEVPRTLLSAAGTLGFRVSSDPVAQKVIADFMEKYHAPLTCTSANKSGLPTEKTPGEILEQLGEDNKKFITDVFDDGKREGLASTVVEIIDDEIKILREGAISKTTLDSVLKI